jgi:flavin reductase (DIM6/NTAB) family NADH-FMN oxidoreductase RutF
MIESDFCGITSGKQVDKFEKTGLTRMPSKIISSPIIKECPLNLECQLTESKMVGATHHFTGEIVQTHIDTAMLKDKKNPGSIDIDTFNPLVYISGVREYRTIGKKIGDAYQIGKQIF